MKADTLLPKFLFPFICLFILGGMPVVSNGRPEASDALGFSFLISFWQTVFALPLFLMALVQKERGIFQRGLLPAVKRRTGRVMVITGIMFGLATWCYVRSLEKAGTTSAAIAIQAYPLVAVLTEMVIFRKLKPFKELMATACLVISLYYLGTRGTWVASGMSGEFLLALTVPLLWSIAHILIREELRSTPITPAQVTLFRVALSTLFLGGLMLLQSPGRLSDLWDLSYLPWAMGMGLLYYLELLSWFYAIRRISVSLASAVTAPWPGVTMVLAWMLLGETIHGYQIHAFAAVVCCIYFLLVD